MTSIGVDAFYNCNSLGSVTIYAPSLETYGYVAFYDNAAGRKIYVFSEYLDDYKTGWSDYADDILPIEGIALADKADNSSLIAAANGNTFDVTLQGRTLYKDGVWNTLCLPFALSAEQIAANAAFAGATLMELNTNGTNGFDPTEGQLYLTFKTATAIEAGVP